MPGQAEGQKDRQKDSRPDFIGPFQLPPGVQQYIKLKVTISTNNEFIMVGLN